MFSTRSNRSADPAKNHHPSGWCFLISVIYYWQIVVIYVIVLCLSLYAIIMQSIVISEGTMHEAPSHDNQWVWIATKKIALSLVIAFSMFFAGHGSLVGQSMSPGTKDSPKSLKTWHGIPLSELSSADADTTESDRIIAILQAMPPEKMEGPRIVAKYPFLEIFYFKSQYWSR